MTRQRWMALCFALGSICFFIGPFPGYAKLVGDSADAVTFFVGSILFTAGGVLQSWLAWLGRRTAGGGPAAWWAAIIQSAGTLFFNVTTYQAMHTAVTNSEYNKLVWRPDLLPRLRRYRLPSLTASLLARMVASARSHGMVAAGGQPARLYLLRYLRRRRLRRPLHGFDAFPGRLQLEHGPWSCVLPRVRARHASHRRARKDA